MTRRDGVFVVDKHSGPTSHDVVDAVRRRLRAGRVGHAGTLDPSATGVLLLLVGRATKLSSLLMDQAKGYRAVIRLGVETDTGDATGRVLRRHEGDLPSEAAVRSALARFVGEIDQVPPMVSALKVGGRRLYEIAREGRTIERAPRRVQVYSLDLLGWAPPCASIDVSCGRGTYIRALATDLGAALGVGGALESLRRTRVGAFDAERAVPLDRLLESIAAGAATEHLVPMETVLAHLPSVVVHDDHRRRLLHGQPTPMREIVAFPAGLAAGDPLRVLDTHGRLLATARAAFRSGDAFSTAGDAVPFQLEHVLADAVAEA